ncbi:MAG: hypothetical protein J1F23_08550 [Oscillospiraceae bacterium]|nr:hypothetical protein [Oscillospiraceae bacterium]
MKTALSIIRICLSVILCIAIAVSLFAATAVKIVRQYLESEEFYQQIESTDISTVKFTVNGKTANVAEFVGNYIGQYTDNTIFSFASPVIDWAISSVLSSDKLNTEVKEELFKEVDYILYSDRNSALERLKNGTDTKQNITIDLLSPDSIEKAVKTYIKNIIISNIESVTGVKSDLIIVLLSEKNVTYLLLAALAAFLILAAINIRKISELLIFIGASSLIYGLSLKLIQAEFISVSAGNEDLFIYGLLSPLVNGLSPYFISSIIIGTVLILLFIVSVLLTKNFHQKT